MILARLEMKPHILIVDDDKRLRDLLQRYLIQEGFLVSTSANLAQAIQALNFFIFDGMILDIMMPGGRGTELFSQGHKLPPALLLSAMGEPHHRVYGLEQGARDYLVKPFEPKELVLRLKNILVKAGKTLAFGEKTYCLQQKVLSCQGRVVALSYAESQLFHYLACRVHQVISRQEIAHHIFPSASNERVVDVQINRLRKKLEDNPEVPQHLLSFRGKGYCLQGHFCGS